MVNAVGMRRVPVAEGLPLILRRVSTAAARHIGCSTTASDRALRRFSGRYALNLDAADVIDVRR